jgi:hypothetical protein
MLLEACAELLEPWPLKVIFDYAAGRPRKIEGRPHACRRTETGVERGPAFRGMNGCVCSSAAARKVWRTTMFDTTEIPRTEWTETLKEFSAMHEGWLVSIDVLSDAMGAQPQVVDLPLLGADFESAGGGLVTLAAARSADDHITHTIQAPRHIWMTRDDSGTVVALEIESADGTRAIVRFRVAALPETVDGVARR